MILSTPRKRSRDTDDDFDMVTQPMGKKTRTSLPLSFPANGASGIQWNFVSPHSRSNPNSTTEEGSIVSNVSETGSVTDDSMDLDGTCISTPWTSPPTIIPTEHRTPRKSDSLLVRPTRPKPYPLQGSQSLHRSTSTPYVGTIATSASIPRTLPLTTDRLPSPIDEDEPHTPTTVAGSQLSLLSVNDMDIDPIATSSDPTPLSGPEGILGSDGDLGLGRSASFVRKQRQRSGAFIGNGPDGARKFQMGYRDDCEKCRGRVPGHMNHILGAS